MSTKTFIYKDFSDLAGVLNTKNQVHFDCTCRTKEEEQMNLQAEIMRKKRAALMSNPDMKFAYEEGTYIIHDKTCHHVKEIGDKDFRMASQIPAGYTICQDCYRRTILRQSLNSTKEMDKCEMFLETLGAGTEDLKRLLVDNQAEIRNLNGRSLWIKVKEDQWIIEKPKDMPKRLMHNSYAVDENSGQRNFDGSFHEQYCGHDKSFHNLVNIMVNYDYNAHKAGGTSNLAAIEYQIDCFLKNDKLAASNKLLKSLVAPNLPEETKSQLISLFSKIYTPGQIKVIEKGLKRGLTIKQLKMFVHPGCNAKQMQEIYSGFLLKLSNTQIEKYGRYDLYAYEMKIRKWRIWFKNLKKKLFKQ